MAKKDNADKAAPAVGTRRITTVVDEPLDPPPPPEQHFDDSQPLPAVDPLLELMPDSVPDEISSLLAELGDTAHKVVVYRYNRTTKKMARLDEWGHTEFSLGMLADTYGGGTYRVYVFRPNGQMAGSKMVEIDEAKKPKHDPTLLPYAAGPGTQVFVPPAPDMSKFMEIMMTQSARSQELVMTMISKMAEGMSAANRAPAAPSVIKDVGDILALQKMLEGKGDPQVNNMKSMLDMLMKGMEIARENTPEGGGGGFMETLTKTILPMLAGQPNFAQTIVGALAPAVLPQPRPYTPPIPNPAPGAQVQIAAAPLAPAAGLQPESPGAVEPAPAVDDDLDILFKEMKKSLLFPIYRGMILRMASDKADFILSADSILNRIPDSYYIIMNDLFTRPDFVERVLKHVPEAVPHKDWLASTVEALKMGIAEYFKGEEEEPAPADPVIEGAPKEEGETGDK